MRISDWSSDVCSSDLYGEKDKAKDQQQPENLGRIGRGELGYLWHETCPAMVGRAASAARRYIQPAYAASGNEDQDHRNDERQQTEKFGCGEDDEQAALLPVSGGGVAQRAFEARTENITHAERGHARDRKDKRMNPSK